MTRTTAREIALGCIFECLFRAAPPEEVLHSRLCEPGTAGLAGEDSLYATVPDEAGEEYIRRLVTAAAQNAEELFLHMSDLSVAWRGERISPMSRAILTLSMTEILQFDDVPDSVSVNEAVELAKKYDSEKAPAFINGILGKFIREIKPGLAGKSGEDSGQTGEETRLDETEEL